MVVLAAGFYRFDTTFAQGSVEISRSGPDGVATIGTASNGPYSSPAIFLQPGVYLFSLRAVGTQPAVYQWRFQLHSIDHEWAIINGVGQNSALSLRLVNSVTSSSTGGSSAGSSPVVPGNPEPVVLPSSPQSGSSSSALVAPAPSGGASTATGVAVIPTSLMVTVGTGLLGTPTLQNESVAAVGPVVAGGSTALASSFPGLLPGLIHRSSGPLDEPAPIPTDPGLATGAIAVTDAGSVELGVPASTGPEVTLAGASSADAQALTKADRITQLVGRLGRWIGLQTGEEAATDGPVPEGSVLIARNDLEPGRDTADSASVPVTERTTEADLGMPIGLILAAAAAYRLRQFARGWWRRVRGQLRVLPRPKLMAPGPRSRSFRGIHASRARRTRLRFSRRG